MKSADRQTAAATLETAYGFRLPRPVWLEFECLVEERIGQVGHTLVAEEVNDFFCQEYIDNATPFELTAINFEKEFVNTEQERLSCLATIKKAGSKPQEIKGLGNGALNSLVNAFQDHFSVELEVIDYLQHGLTQGSHAFAASYIQVANKNGDIFWGVGIDSDCTLSAVRALLSAINRSLRKD